MASKPPSDFDGSTPISTDVSVEDMVRGPVLTHLSQMPRVKPVEFPCSINATYGRVQTFVTASPTAAEKQRLAEENQRFRNNFAIAWLGPIFGAPAVAARTAGASEDGVEAAALLGANFIGAGRGRTPGRRPAVSVAKRRDNLKPDPNAQGSHSTYRTDKDGKVTGHAQWDPNPQNPTGFDQSMRVDTQYASPHVHGGVPTPHTHLPGGVTRPALPGELPP
jgi:hypothetical protein